MNNFIFQAPETGHFVCASGGTMRGAFAGSQCHDHFSPDDRVEVLVFDQETCQRHRVWVGPASDLAS